VIFRLGTSTSCRKIFRRIPARKQVRKPKRRVDFQSIFQPPHHVLVSVGMTEDTFMYCVLGNRESNASGCNGEPGLLVGKVPVRKSAVNTRMCGGEQGANRPHHLIAARAEGDGVRQLPPQVITTRMRDFGLRSHQGFAPRVKRTGVATAFRATVAGWSPHYASARPGLYRGSIKRRLWDLFCKGGETVDFQPPSLKPPAGIEPATCCLENHASVKPPWSRARE
jgi:hypothetical protein